MRWLNRTAYETFTPWSGKHAMVIVGMVAIAVALVGIGRRLPESRRRLLDAALGAAALAIWLFSNLRDAFDPRATMASLLPLHWCDVTGAITVFVLFSTRYRLPRTLLHFWGLCICSLAFIGPVVKVGPAHFEFWRYFSMHGIIVIAAIYDRCVRGYRPTRADWFGAIGVAAAWALLLQPINLAFAANYGYVGRVNWGPPTLLSTLCAWPGRVPLMMGIEAILMGAVLVIGSAPAWLRARIIVARPLPLTPASLQMPTQMSRQAA